MTDEAAKDVSKRLRELSVKLGLCLKLPADVVDPEVADDCLVEMRALANKAEFILRNHGKLPKVPGSN